MRESAVRWSAAVGLVIGLVLTLGLTTDARWTDDISIAGTSMTTGSLDVQVETQGSLDLTGALPGATATAGLTVENHGSVPFDYAVDISGTGGGLLAALDVRLTLNDCAGPSFGTRRTLAPGGSQQVCVRVTLPATAPPAVAGMTTVVSLAVVASHGGWSATAPVGGATVSTVALVSPVVSCGSALLGSIAVGWAPVPHATAYRLHYGPTGDLVETVPADTLSRTFVAVAGVASVDAVFGPGGWVSAPSAPVAYSALAGLLGHCG